MRIIPLTCIGLGAATTTGAYRIEARMTIPTNISSSSTVEPQASSTLLLSTATPTGFPNSTSSASSVPPTTSTCCYMDLNQVGVNLWYSRPYEVTVATVITTWVYSSGTPVVANSTTQSASNVLPDYRSYYFPWDLTLSGIPTTLINSQINLYAASAVVSETAYTFTDQSNLVIQSPTPWFKIAREPIQVYTSRACATVQKYTEILTLSRTDAPVTTTVVLDELDIPGPSLFDSVSGDLQLHGPIEYPFPPGNYSNFSYAEWATMYGDAYGYLDDTLPVDDVFKDFPSYLTSLPSIRSQYADVENCAVVSGEGEPTVHIPVSQVTFTVHSTLGTPDGPVSNPGNTPFGDSITPSSSTPARNPTIPSSSRETNKPTSKQSMGDETSASMPQNTHSSANYISGDSPTSTSDSNPPRSSGIPQTTSIGSQAATISIARSMVLTAHPTVNTAGSSVVVIADGDTTTTLAIGSAATLEGVAISAAPSGGVIAGTGSEASTLSWRNINNAVVTLGSQTVSVVKESSAVVLQGSTIPIGSTAVIDGQTVSVNSQTELVISPISQKSETPVTGYAPSTTTGTVESNAIASSSQASSNDGIRAAAGLELLVIIFGIFIVI